MRFRTTYMDNALFDLPRLIENARRDLVDIDFDTIVVTGMSGVVVAPALALAMNKKFLIHRKETDNSHHGGGQPIGEMGERWIFLDDFVSSGATRDRVMKATQAAVFNRWDTSTPAPVYVGDYLYRHRVFVPAVKAEQMALERAEWERELREDTMAREIEAQVAERRARWAGWEEASIYAKARSVWREAAQTTPEVPQVDEVEVVDTPPLAEPVLTSYTAPVYSRSNGRSLEQRLADTLRGKGLDRFLIPNK